MISLLRVVALFCGAINANLESLIAAAACSLIVQQSWPWRKRTPRCFIAATISRCRTFFKCPNCHIGQSSRAALFRTKVSGEGEA